jgi:hypothetical protein
VAVLIYIVAIIFYVNVEHWDAIETSYWVLMTLLVNMISHDYMMT